MLRINNEARACTHLGALTEILALALAARNKRSLSDEGKKTLRRGDFLGQPAFAPYPLIILCPEAGGKKGDSAAKDGRVCGKILK